MRKIIILSILIILLLVLYFIFGIGVTEFKPRQDNISLVKIKLGGELIKIDKDKLVINTIVDDEESDIPTAVKFEKKTVKIDNNMEYIKITDEIKTEAQFKGEQDLFQKQVSEYKEQGKDMLFLKAPGWYNTKNITFKELKIGSILRINAIEKKSSISAVKIIVERSINKPEAVNINNPMQWFKLSGKIKEISSSKISIVTVIDPNKSTIKSAEITDKTEIIKMSIKSEEQFKKEQEEFNKIRSSIGNNLKANIKAPSWFIETPVNLKALISGQKVKIIVFEKTNKNLEAERIEFIVK